MWSSLTFSASVQTDVHARSKVPYWGPGGVGASRCSIFDIQSAQGLNSKTFHNLFSDLSLWVASSASPTRSAAVRTPSQCVPARVCSSSARCTGGCHHPPVSPTSCSYQPESKQRSTIVDINTSLPSCDLTLRARLTSQKLSLETSVMESSQDPDMAAALRHTQRGGPGETRKKINNPVTCWNMQTWSYNTQIKLGDLFRISRSRRGTATRRQLLSQHETMEKVHGYNTHVWQEEKQLLRCETRSRLIKNVTWPLPRGYRWL